MRHTILGMLLLVSVPALSEAEREIRTLHCYGYSDPTDLIEETRILDVTFQSLFEDGQLIATYDNSILIWHELPGKDPVLAPWWGSSQPATMPQNDPTSFLYIELTVELSDDGSSVVGEWLHDPAQPKTEPDMVGQCEVVTRVAAPTI